MTTAEETFEQWCVLELMGRRRLAGLVREVVIAGAGFLRIDVPAAGADPDDPFPGGSKATTQLYSPSAVYALTPVDQQLAVRLAGQWQPAPVHRFELPAARISVGGGDSEDGEEWPP